MAEKGTQTPQYHASGRDQDETRCGKEESGINVLRRGFGAPLEDLEWRALAPLLRQARPCDPRQDNLPDDLLELVTEAQHAIVAEAERAYRFSVVARAATGRQAGAGNAIEACARALGVSRQLLQSYSALAMRWTPAQFRAALGLRGPHGRPLSLSHLLLIAPLPRSVGTTWIGRVLADGISVRELRQRLRPNAVSGRKWR